MPEPINAAGIPGANLRPDMVEIAATEMSAIGDKVGTQAATVVTTWQRLSAVYEAPEAGTLFGVMDPVKTHGETFDTNIGKVSAALHTYAAEVEPIKAELARIKTEAESFLGSIAGGVEKKTYSRAGVHTSTIEWHEDQDSVDANNALWQRVADQVELLMAAERKCANAIYDIIGFPHIEAATEANPNGYGVEDIPEGTETPWGTTVERSESCGEKFVTDTLWEGVVVNGIWGTVEGLGSLVLGYNPQTGEWFSGDTYAAAWSNLGMLAVGLSIPVWAHPLVANMDGPVGDFLQRGQQTLLNAGKGIVAWDKWEDDPWTAAGEAGFNVASILVPVGAATAPVRASASTAAAALRATARVLNYADPAGLLLDGAGAAIRVSLPTVSDAIRALDFGGGSKIDIDIPTVGRTDITVDTPRAEVDVDIPVRVPEDAVSVPPVREPELVTAGGGNGGGGTVTVGGGGGSVDAPTGGSAGSGGGGADLPTGTGGGTDVPGGTGNGPGGDGSTPTGGGAGGPDGGGTPWNPEMGDPTLSPADHGPDFVRDQTIRTNDIDPTYGDPRANHGTLDPAYAPPPLDQVPTPVRDLVTDPNAPFGRGADGEPYSQAEWEARYLDENGKPIYPGNDGAVEGRRVDFSSVDEFTAHYGDVLDRMGRDTGDFMSFPGTPFEARALPGSNLAAPYTTWRMTGDLPPGVRIEVSEIAPAFGQPGGGLQVRFIDVGPDGRFQGAISVEDLRQAGILQRVSDTSKPNFPHFSDDPAIHYSDRWGDAGDPGDGPGPAATPPADPRPTPDSGGGGGGAAAPGAAGAAGASGQLILPGSARIEPVQFEPVYAEPARIEPVLFEPVTAPLVAVEQVGVDPVTLEPVYAESPVLAPEAAPLADVVPGDPAPVNPQDVSSEGTASSAPPRPDLLPAAVALEELLTGLGMESAKDGVKQLNEPPR